MRADYSEEREQERGFGEEVFVWIFAVEISISIRYPKMMITGFGAHLEFGILIPVFEYFLAGKKLFFGN